MQQSKESTARIALFKEFGARVPCVYTLETSFAGVDFGKASGYHFNTQMLESLGRDLCRTLLVH